MYNLSCLTWSHRAGPASVKWACNVAVCAKLCRVSEQQHLKVFEAKFSTNIKLLAKCAKSLRAGTRGPTNCGLTEEHSSPLWTIQQTFWTQCFPDVSPKSLSTSRSDGGQHWYKINAVLWGRGWSIRDTAACWPFLNVIFNHPLLPCGIIDSSLSAGSGASLCLVNRKHPHRKQKLLTRPQMCDNDSTVLLGGQQSRLLSFVVLGKKWAQGELHLRPGAVWTNTRSHESCVYLRGCEQREAALLLQVTCCLRSTQNKASDWLKFCLQELPGPVLLYFTSQ